MKGAFLQGHFVALFTVGVWGTTFVSTKILLLGLGPFEILLLRFILGYIALWLVCLQKPVWYGLRRELVFAAAGLSGISLYFLLENIALTQTQASNVGIIVSVAPFFTALFSQMLPGARERLEPAFFAGIFVAMTGVFLIGYNGFELGANPLGDFCALGAAAVWGVYAVLTRQIVSYGCGLVPATRRIFLYGLLWILPCFAFFDLRVDFQLLLTPVFFFNLLFLGLGASALCYVTWNRAVAILGAIRTSAYIYAIPVISVLTSWLVLDEAITPISTAGTILALAGLFIAERKKASLAN